MRPSDNTLIVGLSSLAALLFPKFVQADKTNTVAKTAAPICNGLFINTSKNSKQLLIVVIN